MAFDTLQFFLAGALLGLSSGISPGPLLTLVLTQTIKYNTIEGIKVALAPLFSDVPVILLAFFVISRLSSSGTVLALISFVGASFLAYLGIQSLKTGAINVDTGEHHAGSLRKGIIANFLNPHPYLFWISVGIPYALKAVRVNRLSLILFFVSFYLFLVGSKMGVALLVSRTKGFLKSGWYALIMKLLGLCLLLFSILFVNDGIHFLIN